VSTFANSQQQACGQDGGRVSFERNLVYDVDEAGILAHCGVNNSATNNFIVGADSKGTRSYVYGCDYGQPYSLRFARNVLMMTGPHDKLWSHAADQGNVSFGDNVYFSTAGAPLCFPGSTAAACLGLADWQKTGQDKGSRVVDPGFVSAATRDFRLRPDSPLPALGILPISTAVGPRPANRLGAKSDDDHCTGVRPLHDASLARLSPLPCAPIHIGVPQAICVWPLTEQLSMKL